MDKATCNGCGAEIFWVETANKKRMPLETTKRTITTEDGKTYSGYEAHHAYCPKANQFRRARRK